MPELSRTRATLRSAELGFFGVVVYTRVHTPRFCGDPFNAGAPVFDFCRRRPWRTSRLSVGTDNLLGGTRGARIPAGCGRPPAQRAGDDDRMFVLTASPR